MAAKQKTPEQIEEAAQRSEDEPRHPVGYRVLRRGASVLAMTPTTHYWTGRVVDFDALTVVLEDAAWIVETGRHSEALKTGALDEVEVEPLPIEIPRIGTVFIAWPHPLPRETK